MIRLRLAVTDAIGRELTWYETDAGLDILKPGFMVVTGFTHPMSERAVLTIRELKGPRQSGRIEQG